MNGLGRNVVTSRLAVVKWPQVVFVLTRRLVVLRERATLPSLAVTKVVPGSLCSDVHCIVVASSFTRSLCGNHREGLRAIHCKN